MAIISNRLWHTRFGGDPGIVGRSVRISGQSTTVVGVMPPGLLLIGTDLWMPWGGNVDACPATAGSSRCGPASPGASLAAANAGARRRSRGGPIRAIAVSSRSTRAGR